MRQVLDRAEDSPEEIAVCLNCTKPANACNWCTGPTRSRGRRSNAYPQDVRDRAVQLVLSGMTIRWAAREAGVGMSTLAGWLTQYRKGDWP